MLLSESSRNGKTGISTIPENKPDCDNLSSVSNRSDDAGAKGSITLDNPS